MNNFLKICGVILIAGLVMAVTVTRPNWAFKGVTNLNCTVAAAVQLTSLAGKMVKLKADEDNANPLWVGVDNTVNANVGRRMDPGDEIELEVSANASEIWCRGETGDGLVSGAVMN